MTSMTQKLRLADESKGQPIELQPNDDLGRETQTSEYLQRSVTRTFQWKEKTLF